MNYCWCGAPLLTEEDGAMISTCLNDGTHDPDRPLSAHGVEQQ